MLDPADPFVLLDDVRAGGAPARLYRHPVELLEARTVAAVRPALTRIRAAVADGLSAAGFLSYEAAPAFEPTLPAQPSPTPLLWFGLFDGWEDVDVAALLPDPAGARVLPPRPAIAQPDYDRRIDRVLALIAAGDLYQANLTFQATVPFLGDPLALYAAVRARAAAGWGGIVSTGTDLILSFSPELFFSVADGAITCRPMKGTARPGEGAAAKLAADPKQRAENLMIVDLLRNDLSRVATPGSVRVPALFAVEHYPTVLQLTSTVTADLAPDRDEVDLLAAAFPCGSITGAPKLRAIEALAAIEDAPRGIYTGAIGAIDPDGAARFNVAIRTLTVRDGAATMGLGGGIVADSTAADEWDEALAKGAFLTQGQRVVDLIETMRFDPLDGLLLLDRHMARMTVSAAALGLRFDRHDARNELQAATFRLREGKRVRLLLAPSGAMAIEVAPLPPTPALPIPVAIVPLPVAPADWRLRHKSSDRAFYDRARQQAGTAEIVFVTPDGLLTEGSYTNVFVHRDDRLVTPPLALGLLPGVLRAELIATGRAAEGDLTVADLAEGFLLGNALRGLMPAIVAVADRPTAP
ncbi:aminodeoxychorismate synthase component I [Sphingomonas sp.]|uniref:aminodeoxychorismate synthase component I n=1 Tax=Sphingomonas sp. TaxID=28214 RepID=UPI003B00DCA3